MTARPGPLTRDRDFLRLWTAETVSQFGSQVSSAGDPAHRRDDPGRCTPFEFGLLATIQFLPFILFSLPAGVWVDRLRRRPILIVGDLGRAVALASIPIAFALGALTIWQLYIVGFVVGSLTVFFDVSYQSYLPALVERDQLVDGNSKLEISRSAAAVVGPGLTGVLIGAVGAATAVIVDVGQLPGFRLLHLADPQGRARSARRRGRRAGTAPGPGMRREVTEGLRFVIGNRYLRRIAACTGTSNLFFNIALARSSSCISSGTSASGRP